jgi:hypothetical protein
MKTQVMRWMIALCVLLFVAGFLITVIVIPGYAQSNSQQETVDAAVDAYFTQTALAYEDLVLSATARPEYNIAQTATTSFQTTVDAQFQNAVLGTASAVVDAAANEAVTIADSLSLTRITVENSIELAQVFALDGKNPVTDAEFSSSSQWLASGHENGNVIIWDLQTGDVVHLLVGHERRVSALMFSPDDRILATGDSAMFVNPATNFTVRIWDTETGQQLHILYGDVGVAAAMVFSADGLRLFTMSVLGDVYVWNTLTGELLYQLPTPPQSTFGNNINYIALAVSQDNEVWVVDDEFNVIIYELPNTEGEMFSITSSRIARGFTNFRWDVAPQAEFFNLRGDFLFSADVVQDINTGEEFSTVGDILTIQENNYMLAVRDAGIIKIFGVFTGARSNEIATQTAVFIDAVTATAVQAATDAQATTDIRLTNIAATSAVRTDSRCPGTIVEDQGDVLRIVRTQPDLDLTVSMAVRAGMEIEVHETRENETGVWYEIYQGNQRIGWVQAQYVVLDCE